MNHFSILFYTRNSAEQQDILRAIAAKTEDRKLFVNNDRSTTTRWISGKISEESILGPDVRCLIASEVDSTQEPHFVIEAPEPPVCPVCEDEEVPGLLCFGCDEDFIVDEGIA